MYEDTDEDEVEVEIEAHNCAEDWPWPAQLAWCIVNAQHVDGKEMPFPLLARACKTLEIVMIAFGNSVSIIDKDTSDLDKKE